MALAHFHMANFMFLSILTIITAASDDGYDLNHSLEKPKQEKEKLLSTIIGIQGLVYCKSGHMKTIPLEGAVTRVTCLAVDEYGYETAPFSFLSDATDAKGYFLATLSPSELQSDYKIKDCKAFLELSPLETCKVATDVNNGISGAPLASYRFLGNKEMKLFTVGPFFYTSHANSNSNY